MVSGSELDISERYLGECVDPSIGNQYAKLWLEELPCSKTAS